MHAMARAGERRQEICSAAGDPRAPTARQYCGWRAPPLPLFLAMSTCAAQETSAGCPAANSVKRWPHSGKKRPTRLPAGSTKMRMKSEQGLGQRQLLR
jgi:hypothetical protein